LFLLLSRLPFLQVKLVAEMDELLLTASFMMQ